METLTPHFYKGSPTQVLKGWECDCACFVIPSESPVAWCCRVVIPMLMAIMTARHVLWERFRSSM